MKDEKVVNCLNKILELELAGVVKYTHYAFMVQGPYRLSIVQWLRTQAHALRAALQTAAPHDRPCANPPLPPRTLCLQVWSGRSPCQAVSSRTDPRRAGPHHIARSPGRAHCGLPPP